MPRQKRITIADIRAAHNAAGLFFFKNAKSAFTFHKIHPYVYQGPGGIFFVESQQDEDRITCKVWEYTPSDHRIFFRYAYTHSRNEASLSLAKSAARQVAQQSEQYELGMMDNG